MAFQTCAAKLTIFSSETAIGMYSTIPRAVYRIEASMLLEWI
jgi:hypothetical protein